MSTSRSVVGWTEKAVCWMWLRRWVAWLCLGGWCPISKRGGGGSSASSYQDIYQCNWVKLPLMAE